MSRDTGRLRAGHEEHSTLLTFPDQSARQLPATSSAVSGRSVLSTDRLWGVLDDFGDAAFGASLGYRGSGVPGEAWFPSAYPCARLVLILGFAVSSCFVGAFGMGIYEEAGLAPINDLPDRLRAALWREHPEWLVVPTGCAIEDVLPQDGGVCRIDLSFVAPWPPHHRMAHRLFCGPSDSGSLFVSTDDSEVNPPPSCMTVLNRDCSQIQVGVEYAATCYVYRESPHVVRMVMGKAQALQEIHAALNSIMNGFHGPMGKVGAKLFLYFSAVLLIVAVITWLCDVMTDKIRVRRCKNMLVNVQPSDD